MEGGGVAESTQVGERLVTRHTSLGNVPMLTNTLYAGWTQGVNNSNQKIRS